VSIDKVQTMDGWFHNTTRSGATLSVTGLVGGSDDPDVGDDAGPEQMVHVFRTGEIIKTCDADGNPVLRSRMTRLQTGPQ